MATYTFQVGVKVESSAGHAYTKTVRADTIPALLRGVREACEDGRWMMGGKKPSAKKAERGP